MKLSSSTLLGFLLLSFISAAQDPIVIGFEVPKNLPTTKEEFIKSEPDLINAAKWLEATRIGVQMDKRTKVNAYVIAWITNSPTVNIELRATITKLFANNNQLLAVYMAGYTRYCLENNYSTDKLKCNTAGIKSAINCYDLGGDVRKDKELVKAIAADQEGRLEDWVKEAMKGE